jgi:catechol 2,3-dioxygenase-like lactoylglutathione lyase family enzyme
MTHGIRFLLVPLCALAFAGSALAQAKDDRIIFGHIHLHPTDLAAHKKFWNETLGGIPLVFGNNIEAVRLDPGPHTKGLGHTINLTSASYKTPPTGGTKGTTVPHVGFSVPNLNAVLARARANGYQILTSDAKTAMVVGPDDIQVELVEIPSQKVGLDFHHIHFAGPNAAEMAAWYEKVFGVHLRGGSGGPGREGAVYLSGLTFEHSSVPVAGTQGTSLDHIGFEVRDLEAFVKELEAMGVKPARAMIKANIKEVGSVGVLFVTDPWGTYIELNEGYRAEPAPK